MNVSMEFSITMEQGWRKNSISTSVVLWVFENVINEKNYNILKSMSALQKLGIGDQRIGGPCSERNNAFKREEHTG